MKILKWIKRVKDFFSGQKKTTISVNGNNIHKEKDVMNVETESGDIKIENYHTSNSRGIFAIVIVLLILIVVNILVMIHDRKSSVGKKVIQSALIMKMCLKINMYMEIMMN